MSAVTLFEFPLFWASEVVRRQCSSTVAALAVRWSGWPGFGAGQTGRVSPRQTAPRRGSKSAKRAASLVRNESYAIVVERTGPAQSHVQSAVTSAVGHGVSRALRRSRQSGRVRGDVTSGATPTPTGSTGGAATQVSLSAVS